MRAKIMEVRAPASIANLGPGFDVFGLALREPYDILEAVAVQGTGARVIKVEGVGAQRITLDPKRNTAAVAASEVLRMAKADFGLEITVRKGVRPCSGMGSSGASAAGAAFAANLMVDVPLSQNNLVLCAAKGEEVSSGGLHADNVAPSLLGGFTLIRSYDPLDVIRVTPPKDLGIVAALPDIIVPTKEARGVLPKSIDLRQMVFQVGHASALATGMSLGDLALIGRSVRDMVIEPARRRLVPHLEKAERAALDAGALAAFLGGSGPCVAAFFDRRETNGDDISKAIGSVYEAEGIRVDSWVTSWGDGCRREKA